MSEQQAGGAGAGTHAGRIAVVTGASAGIGEAVARRLASEGASVVVNARRADRLERLVEEIREGGGAAEACAGDAVEEAVIASMLDTAAERFGGEADLVVVNAGRGLRGSPLTSDPGQWEEMIRLNLLGATRLIRAASERMRSLVPAPAANAEAWQDRARDIVVLGSTVGRHLSPFSSMYGSTKFAIGSVAEAVRRELAPEGIRVAQICPAIVRSEFQEVAGYDPERFGAFMEEIGPVLEPEDIADVVAYITGLPARVLVNDVMIRGVRQAYP